MGGAQPLSDRDTTIKRREHQLLSGGKVILLHGSGQGFPDDLDAFQGENIRNLICPCRKITFNAVRQSVEGGCGDQSCWQGDREGWVADRKTGDQVR